MHTISTTITTAAVILLTPAVWQCGSSHTLVFISVTTWTISVPSTRMRSYLKSTTVHVVCAETIGTFKTRLDKHWSDQEVSYDNNADLHGIGNRSIYVTRFIV